MTRFVKNDPLQKLTEIIERDAVRGKDHKRTIGTVVANMGFDFLERRGFRGVFVETAKASAFTIATLSFYRGWDFPTLVARVMTWQHGVITCAFVVWFVIYRFSTLRFALGSFGAFLRRNVSFHVAEAPRTAPDVLFGGLPKEDLLSFLAEHRDLHMGRWMAMHPDTRKNDLTRVIKALQEARLLVKGDNNSNVLTDAMGWESIAATIEAADTPEDLARPLPARLRIISNGAEVASTPARVTDCPNGLER